REMGCVEFPDLFRRGQEESDTEAPPSGKGIVARQLVVDHAAVRESGHEALLSKPVVWRLRLKWAYCPVMVMGASSITSIRKPSRVRPRKNMSICARGSHFSLTSSGT